MSLLDFLAVKNTKLAAGEQLQSLSAKGIALRTQLAAIDSAAAAKSDVKIALNRWVDEMAAGFSDVLSSKVAGLVHEPRSVTNPRHINYVMSLFAEPVSRDEDPKLRLHQTLCGLFGPQIKAALAKAVDANTWAEGLPMAERPAAREAISAQLKTVNAEERELREAAKEAGITL